MKQCLLLTLSCLSLFGQIPKQGSNGSASSGGSMTWPIGGAGITIYNGASGWSTPIALSGNAGDFLNGLCAFVASGAGIATMTTGAADPVASCTALRRTHRAHILHGLLRHKM